MPSAQNPDNNPDLRVAIIGGGITGINLALGLQARNIDFTIYERAPEFREIGAGIGFSPNAERAMTMLDPNVLAAFKATANPNGEDYFQWLNGLTDETMHRLHVGKDGFQGCRRSDILDAWAKMIKNPEKRVRFGKQVDTIDDSPDGMTIHFADGTTAAADVVIGCDGIRSRVRQLVLGEDTPAASPHYTAKYCYRALVPMDRAVATIGEEKSFTRFMYLGPNAHIITYPVGNNSVLNVLAVLSDPSPWPDKTKHIAPGSKKEVVDAFAGWHPTVQGIASLFPDEMEKWAIFDMADWPASTYIKGRVALAGDAAHATGPHLGAGAGLGIEDAMLLSELLVVVKRETAAGGDPRGKRVWVEAALEAYHQERYQRTQEVVQWTREACEWFHWRDRDVGSDGGKFGAAITPRFLAIWRADVDAMVKNAVASMGERVEAVPKN